MNQTAFRLAYSILFPAMVIFAIALHQNSIFGLMIRGSSDKHNVSVDLNQAQSFFIDATNLTEKELWFEPIDKDGKHLGYLIHSDHYSPDVRGYNGKVPLLIALDQEKKIKAIRMLPNRETGDFVEILRENHFLESWNNMHLKEVLSVQIDAISGATETCDAVIKNIHNSAVGFSSVSNEFIAGHLKSWNKKKVFEYAALFFFMLFALASFLYPKRTRKYRNVLLILSIVILGVWLTRMLTLADFYNLIIGGFNLNSQIVFLVLLVFAVGLPLITGKNFYCYYVCPYGCVQELCGKLRNRKLTFKGRTYHYLKLIRKYLITGIAVVLLIGWSFDLTKVEPFLAFSYRIVSIFVMILALVFIFLSFVINRLWCNYFCPTGMLLSLFKIKKIKNEKAGL
jgi:NosR/NirI family transcriptional regulator, nitrous oxide reductase regulator